MPRPTSPIDAPGVPQVPRNPYAVTGPDGTFRITTFQEGDGAAEGGYQIVLMWPATADDAEGPDEAKDADNWRPDAGRPGRMNPPDGRNARGIVRIGLWSS